MEKVDICQNLDKIKTRIEVACKDVGRQPNEIMLLAVSKTKPDSYIKTALACGQLEFGENRMQELEEKMLEIEDEDISWHMIGNLQTNKIKLIAERVNWVHSIDKIKYLREFEKRAHNNKIKALIQVNISGEAQKGGVEPENVGEFLDQAKDLENIVVVGLMGMATFTDNPEDVRPEFKLLKEVFDKHKPNNKGSVQLEHLSMGMSNDLEVAIEEGATIVRVGSDIFGARNYN